jgi:hypothetical protein
MRSVDRSLTRSAHAPTLAGELVCAGAGSTPGSTRYIVLRDFVRCRETLYGRRIMRLSHRYRFIFFSNPKTGSESVRALLDPYSDVAGVPYWQRTADMPFYSHIRPVEVRDLFLERGWDFEGYFRFTFVRNPWARLVSLYEMIFHGKPLLLVGSARSGKVRDVLGLHPSPRGFRRWLRGTAADGPGGGGPDDQRWQRYGTYTVRAYAGDEQGSLLVSRVIRLEDIDRELTSVLSELRLPGVGPGAIPAINRRKYGSYVSYYDDATAELVAQRYAEDVETYGYVYGS